MKLSGISKIIFSCVAVFGLSAVFFSNPVTVLAEEEQEFFKEISDAAELADIANDPQGNYRLTQDIYLDKESWKPIPFSGKLEGDGFTIYNMNVTCVDQNKRVTRDGNLKQYDTEFAGLFSVMENAEVNNLNIKGAFVDISDRSHCFAAILAGYSDNSKVKGCCVEGRVHLVNSGINVGVAGIAGWGTGIFEECAADVELVFEDRYTSGKCEQFLGGILSCGIAEIKNCDVRINGYDSCHGYVHNGGIVGMFYLCGTRYRGNCISGCNVEGQISFFEDNTDRRAYCKPFAGEPLTTPRKIKSNTSQFECNETKDYSKVLSPEKCDKPDYENTVIPPDCTKPGYTTHKCRGCGYCWTDDYTHPRHEAGEWVVVSQSDFEKEGLEKQYCSKCGVLMNEKTTPIRQPRSEEKGSSVIIWITVISGILAAVSAISFAIVLANKRKRTA